MTKKSLQILSKLIVPGKQSFQTPRAAKQTQRNGGTAPPLHLINFHMGRKQIQVYNSKGHHNRQSTLTIFLYILVHEEEASTSLDPINRRMKIPESSKKQNLNLPCTKHYTQSTQMKWYVGIPYYSLYTNIGYMQILHHFT